MQLLYCEILHACGFTFTLRTYCWIFYPFFPKISKKKETHLVRRRSSKCIIFIGWLKIQLSDHNGFVIRTEHQVFSNWDLVLAPPKGTWYVSLHNIPLHNKAVLVKKRLFFGNKLKDFNAKIQLFLQLYSCKKPF